MSTAQAIIQRFGGASALARLLGKTPGAIQYWARVGTIPARWQVALLALAREQGIDLTPSDFIPEPSNLNGQSEYGGEIGLPREAEWQGVLTIGGFELPVSFRLTAVR